MNPMHIPGRSISTSRLMAARIAAAKIPPRNAPPTSRVAAMRRWMTGAGADASTDVYDPATQGPAGADSQYDPNVEAGTGTKSSYASAASSGTTTTALPSPDSSVYNSTQVSVAAPSGANLRDQPSLSGNIITGEPYGTILTVVGPQQNGWLHVQDPQGRTGWVYSAYVQDASTQTASDVSQAPLALGSGTAARGVASSGLTGLAVVSGALLAGYYLFVK